MKWTDYAPYLLAIASWLPVEAMNAFSVRPRREIWDNPDYFTTGLPFIYIFSFLLGWLFPDSKRAWVWGALPFATQFPIMFVRDPVANLMPLGAILLVFLALPAVGLSLLGAWLRRKFKSN